MVKALTAKQVEAFVRKAVDGDKLRVGDGLYILRRGDHCFWRYDYRWGGGKRSTTSLGRYPTIGLKAARDALVLFKADLARGICPATKRAEKEEQARAGKPFSEVAEAYLHRRGPDLKYNTMRNVIARFKNHVLPELGGVPAEKVGVDDIRKVVLSVSSPTLARKLLRDLVDVVRFAKGAGFMGAVALDDVRGVADALPKVGEHKHHAGVTTQDGLVALLKKIEAIPIASMVGIAIRLLPHLFVRIETLTGARWNEFDLPGMVWRIPGEDGRMKGVRGREPSLDVPLSPSVIALLQRLQTMQDDGEPFLFPSSSKTGHMDTGTIGKALKRHGIPSSVATPHGFRTTASTLLREVGGFSDDVVERALAHVTGNSVQQAYDRSTRLEERRRMLCWWSSYLDALCDGTPVPLSPMMK